MTGLIDYIFSNLEERNLDGKQIHAYIRYLDEIILNGSSMEKELEYQALKRKLTRRLNELHQEQISFSLPGKEDKGKKDN